MQLCNLLLLPSLLAASAIAQSSALLDDYNEHLHLKPLPGGYLYAGFNFTASTLYSDYENQHFRFFPRSLGQILQHTHTKELHLRFAAGRWNDENWGCRPRNGMREGGTGVEIWAWIEREDQEQLLRKRWDDLVNSLSGLFCASLNFIDGTRTVKPVLTFDREGVVPKSGNDLQLLHGVLPHEVVCTENLTPLLKLLPCKGKTGISSLLDGHKVFDANWQTMSIDVRPVCQSGGSCALELQTSVDMVLDIERSMRPRDDPIPRPRPVEEMECDESKHYNADDTCYPKVTGDELAWSLKKLFGQSAKGACHVGSAKSSRPDITLEVPQSRAVDTLPSAKLELQNRVPRTFILPEKDDFDLTLPRQALPEHERIPIEAPTMYVNRHMTGYGQQHGGMHTILRNPKPYVQRVVYLESLPWYLRPYMHTLKVKGGTLDKMYFIPAIDRERGSQLELSLSIPAHAQIDLTYDFDKAILRYTEYPPDANRGFDVAAAVIRVLGANNTDASQDNYLRTTSLLLPLPTPDFSMPYNVIILTSTVIALGFGSIFNLLVRRFVLASEVPEGALTQKLKMIRDVVRDKIRAKLAETKKPGASRDSPQDASPVADGKASPPNSTAKRPRKSKAL